MLNICSLKILIFNTLIVIMKADGLEDLNL